MYIYVISTSGYTMFFVMGSSEVGDQMALMLSTEVTLETAT
jgi:hypothetical protein